MPSDYPLLTASFLSSPVVDRNGYPYFVNPVSDGIPRMDAALLDEVADGIISLCDLDCDVVLAPEAESDARQPLSVAPNNPLYAPYLRTPLPIGLWAYNNLYTPREKGPKYWLYRRLAKEPVLISKVQPQLRAKVAEQALGNNGYFGSQVASELLYRKKRRNAKVDYTLRIAPPYRYGSIAYPEPGGAIGGIIDSLRDTSPQPTPHS